MPLQRKMASLSPANVSTMEVLTPTPSPTFKESVEKVVTCVGQGGDDPFPVLDRAWDIYAGKGVRTVFVSIGSSKSALADLEIGEGLGCPIHVVALSDAEKASWTEVQSILKERKRQETASAFSKGAEGKWILPKNVRLVDSLPWWEKGTVDVSGIVLPTLPIDDFMRKIAVEMKLKDAQPRLDILKIDADSSAPGLEKAILGAVLSAGYRPSMILVKWNKMPDVDLSTTLAAGHLQNSGYSLLGKKDNKFLYYFSDSDLYQICSWEGVVANNPIVTEVLGAAGNMKTFP
jgi:hypothetical protein